MNFDSSLFLCGPNISTFLGYIRYIRDSRPVCLVIVIVLGIMTGVSEHVKSSRKPTICLWATRMPIPGSAVVHLFHKIFITPVFWHATSLPQSLCCVIISGRNQHSSFFRFTVCFSEEFTSPIRKISISTGFRPKTIPTKRFQRQRIVLVMNY